MICCTAARALSPHITADALLHSRPFLTLAAAVSVSHPLPPPSPFPHPSGTVPQGVQVHPNQRHIIYPLGSTIVVKDIVDDTQFFLQGHNNEVSCLALSSDGKTLASGQKTFPSV